MENGKEFILEKLFRGSIVNYRTFFMDEDGKVFYRFARSSILAMIDHEKLIGITERHPKLKKKFSLYKKKFLIQDKTIPLDYIMTLPNHLIKA